MLSLPFDLHPGVSGGVLGLDYSSNYMLSGYLCLLPNVPRVGEFVRLPELSLHLSGTFDGDSAMNKLILNRFKYTVNLSQPLLIVDQKILFQIYL